MGSEHSRELRLAPRRRLPRTAPTATASVDLERRRLAEHERVALDELVRSRWWKQQPVLSIDRALTGHIVCIRSGSDALHPSVRHASALCIESGEVELGHLRSGLVIVRGDARVQLDTADYLIVSDRARVLARGRVCYCDISGMARVRVADSCGIGSVRGGAQLIVRDTEQVQASERASVVSSVGGRVTMLELSERARAICSGELATATMRHASTLDYRHEPSAGRRPQVARVIMHDESVLAATPLPVSVSATSYAVTIGHLDPSHGRVHWLTSERGVRPLVMGGPPRRRLTRKLVGLVARHPFHCSECLALVNSGEHFWSAGLLLGGICSACRSQYSPLTGIRSVQVASSLAFVAPARPRDRAAILLARRLAARGR